MTRPPERLRQGRDITAVLRSRRRRGGRLAVVHVRRRQESGPPRVAVVASRRVGGAVARNRAKRLLREAARHLPLAADVDLVLLARAACAQSNLGEVVGEVGELLARLGVLAEAGPATHRGYGGGPGPDAVGVVPAGAAAARSARTAAEGRR